MLKLVFLFIFFIGAMANFEERGTASDENGLFIGHHLTVTARHNYTVSATIEILYGNNVVAEMDIDEEGDSNSLKYFSRLSTADYNSRLEIIAGKDSIPTEKRIRLYLYPLYLEDDEVILTFRNKNEPNDKAIYNIEFTAKMNTNTTSIPAEPCYGDPVEVIATYIGNYPHGTLLGIYCNYDVLARIFLYDDGPRVDFITDEDHFQQYGEISVDVSSSRTIKVKFPSSSSTCYELNFSVGENGYNDMDTAKHKDSYKSCDYSSGIVLELKYLNVALAGTALLLAFVAFVMAIVNCKRHKQLTRVQPI